MAEFTHITDYLERNAKDYTDIAAFICDERTLTWNELNLLVDALSQQLLSLVPGSTQQVIGLLLPNSWQFMVAYLAILKAGHIALPLDPGYKTLEITAVVEQIPPILSITNQALGFEFPKGQQLLLEGDFATELPAKLLNPVRLPATEQIASLLFTSGTTGKPKATAYTHANYIWNVTEVTDIWQWTHEDTLLLSLPLSHWHGLALGITGALNNANTVYLHAHFDAERTLQALASGEISLFMHVPIAYFKLVDHNPQNIYDISKVRLCVSGSSFLPPAIWQSFYKRFGHKILERYGSSETGLISSNTLDDKQPGNVGFVLPGVQVRVEPDGQLAMKSGGLFAGYYNNPQATKANFTKDGWWLTGDIGKFNDNGRLKLVGRIQEKIKRFGYTLYPRDIEWALMAHAKVNDIVVVGVQIPDALNDELVYFVVTDLSDTEIIAYSKANLPSFWRPDRIIHLPEIPKSKAGKPQLVKLRAML